MDWEYLFTKPRAGLGILVRVIAEPGILEGTRGINGYGSDPLV